MICAVNLLFNLKNGKPATKMETVDYCEKHEDELNRAWRSMLNGEGTKSLQKASLGLAAYLMLQSGKMPFYEVEVFFKVFCTGESRGTDGYEVSPIMVARKTFMDLYKGFGSLRAQKEQLDVAIQAMNDFHAGKKRANNYKIAQPFAFEPLMKSV